MFSRELRWFGSNVAILLVYAFGFTVAQGTVLLALSTNGSIGPGWSGNPIRQVLGWGLEAGIYLIFYSPFLAAVLGPYRLIVRVVGHPRAVALAMAAAVTAGLGLLLPRSDPALVAVVGVATIGYAAVLRLPGQTLAELPAVARGLILGLALSFAWLVGSVAALVWAGSKAFQGDWTEAGAIAVATTAIPAALLFADLFRADVPGANYVITGVLIVGCGLGIASLVRHQIRTRLRAGDGI